MFWYRDIILVDIYHQRNLSMKPLGKVKIQWSPKLAYALGLIASDGCLYSDGRHISFTSMDRPLALLFQRCLGIHVKLGNKKSGSNGGIAYHIQFGDVLFYRWLVSIGLTPNKSKTIGKLKIPDKLFFDFLRGCFDGDGSVYAYWDPRWKSSYMFYWQLCSASPEFLIWVRETIYRLVKIRGTMVQSKGTKQLRYAKRETRILFKKLYYKKGLPSLHRKLAKIKLFFIIDERNQ